MKINRNNYELFFIDYLDGKLSHSEELELMAFLTGNPDLDEELNLVRNIKIEPEKIFFVDKNSLKKASFPEISSEKFYELCVGKIEKALSHDDEILLAQYMELNPEKVKDLQLFEKTILKADTTIKFSNKESLKRIEISCERFNELCVAKIENEILMEDENILSAYINQNPLLEKDIELFSQTIAKPDLSIQYPDKQSLKRHVVGISYRKMVFRSLSAAAAIVLLFLVYTFFNNTDQHGNSPRIFATSLHSLNYKEVQKQTLINKKANNNIAVNNNKAIKINHQAQVINMDTTHSLANDNNILKHDSTVKKNEIRNLPELNTGNYMAENNGHNHDNFDKTYDAIFAESKYSHFRDMIENVPYEAIQSSPSGMNNLSVWDVVEEGSKGISAITGTDVDFQKKTDKRHKTDKYSFRIGRFGFSRTVHK